MRKSSRENFRSIWWCRLHGRANKILWNRWRKYDERQFATRDGSSDMRWCTHISIHWVAVFSSSKSAQRFSLACWVARVQMNCAKEQKKEDHFHRCNLIYDQCSACALPVIYSKFFRMNKLFCDYPVYFNWFDRFLIDLLSEKQQQPARSLNSNFLDGFVVVVVACFPYCLLSSYVCILWARRAHYLIWSITDNDCHHFIPYVWIRLSFSRILYLRWFI